MMPPFHAKSHFKTLLQLDIDFSPNALTLYSSERTGMRVVVVDQESPKVLGFFALATEIRDDSGAPHTLEHLCFMGSKTYRYKGFLDQLATRAYSTTNAWTATDHTAYTLETAGWEGFAQILPVYLEHVLAPTLTDSACYTEVHHVDGTGHDAGVVYSEMQGVQHTQDELMELASKRLLYPEGMGFRYETGGMMEQLRVLTADRIRKFHREMYQPKNLCLVLVGEIDHHNLLQVLDGFEDAILEDIPEPDAPFQRPWMDSPQPPPLTRSTTETVEFPEEDESIGGIMISTFGPSCTDSLYFCALSVLLAYLAGSSASVLDNTLVEKEQLASAVYYSTDNRPNTVIQFVLSGVATEALDRVESRFFEVLQETANNELDMTYLHDCITRSKRQIKFAAETSESYFADPIIKDFLFGKRDGSTLKTFEGLAEYDELQQWTDMQWRGLIKKWMSDTHHVVILGKPSAWLSKKLESDEKARVAAQKEALGEDGLKRLEDELARAKAENDKEIPKGFLERFKIPNTTSIHFINTITARSGAARKMGQLENPIQKLVDHDHTKLPLFIHFESIRTNFVDISLVMSTESIPTKLRPLLYLYLDSFFSLPILKDGKRIPFERVIMDLERDTVGYSIDFGTNLGNPETLVIRLQTEAEKYAEAIKWLRYLLFNSIFDLTRLKAITAKLLANIPEEKRSGNGMAHAVSIAIHASQASITRARGTLTQALYLKRISRLLESAPDNVVTHLSSIRTALAQQTNFRVLVIANLHTLAHPVSTWKTLTADLPDLPDLEPLPNPRDRLSPAGLSPGSIAYIIPLPTIDSSYAVSVAKGPVTPLDPQVPALMVALAYLDAVEGPLWTAVRGTGLAYGTSFARSPETGHLSFEIYRSPNAFASFRTSKAVVEAFATGATPFDSLALEGAVSSIVLGIANAEPTMATAAVRSFARQVVRGLPADWNAVLLHQVRQVAVPDIRAVMRDLVLPVFEPATANLVVTCAPVMVELLRTGFTDLGFSPEVKALVDFQDDYGLKAEDGEGEEEEEEEEDDEDDELEGEEEGGGGEEGEAGNDDDDDDDDKPKSGRL